MSKTTQKLGNPKFVLNNRTDWPARPSRKLQKLWKKWDDASMKTHGKLYDALTDKQKIDLHYEINVAKEGTRGKEDGKATAA